jgi:hypothetical protein
LKAQLERRSTFRLPNHQSQTVAEQIMVVGVEAFTSTLTLLVNDGRITSFAEQE